MGAMASVGWTASAKVASGVNSIEVPRTPAENTAAVFNHGLAMFSAGVSWETPAAEVLSAI